MFCVKKGGESEVEGGRGSKGEMGRDTWVRRREKLCHGSDHGRNCRYLGTVLLDVL